MDKKERINEAYKWLEYKHVIDKQEDVAEKMGSTQANVSSALKGVQRVLTDSFLRRFAHAYSDYINIEWLLSGDGEMLVNRNEVTVPMPSGMGDSIPSWADSLIYRVSENTKALETLLKENSSLRKDMAAMRAEIKQLRADLGAALQALRHHPAIYELPQESPTLPMAAESSSNNK